MRNCWPYRYGILGVCVGGISDVFTPLFGDGRFGGVDGVLCGGCWCERGESEVVGHVLACMQVQVQVQVRAWNLPMRASAYGKHISNFIGLYYMGLWKCCGVGYDMHALVEGVSARRKTSVPSRWHRSIVPITLDTVNCRNFSTRFMREEGLKMESQY